MKKKEKKLPEVAVMAEKVFKEALKRPLKATAAPATQSQSGVTARLFLSLQTKFLYKGLRLKTKEGLIYSDLPRGTGICRHFQWL